MTSPTPRFCSQCGGPLIAREVEHEQRVRLVCSQCGVIAYQNPRVLVSTIVGVAAGVAAREQVLLCKRAEAPAQGRWTVPGGFMECGETLEEAAVRETFEETGVRLDPRALTLHTLSTLPELSEVYVGFVASVAEPVTLACGPECAEVAFFDEDSLPWGELTYPDVVDYLRMYFRDRRDGQHAIHFSRLDALGQQGNRYRVADVQATKRLR